MRDRVQEQVHCPYCGRPAVLVTGREVYPHRPDLAHKYLWTCEPCDARVGTHKGTKEPLGRLANAELRRAKMDAHAALDPLWRSGELTRSQAYEWLAGALGINSEECHIGMFDLEQCGAVVRAVQTRGAP